MTPAEVDHDDRWGKACTTSPRCTALAEFLTSYRYRTGRAGRVSTAGRSACADHVKKFAAQHGIQIGPAPEHVPDVPGLLAAAVEAITPPTTMIELSRRYDGSWLVTKYGEGSNMSGTVWLDRVSPGAPFGEALAAAEASMAARYRLVPTTRWRIDGETARTLVAPAEDTDQWADAHWVLTIVLDDRVWTVTALLDPRFRIETWPLGTNLDIERAVRTAPTLMGQRWTVGEWTITGATATATATRKRTT